MGKRLKFLVRWGIVAAAAAFLAHTLIAHWQAVGQLRLTAQGWSLLAVALGTTLLAHCWSGLVWGWIVRLLQQPVDLGWCAVVYLQTNLGKYLPGNVWHFWGRVQALRQQGMAPGGAVVAVVLEPVLLAVAALAVGLASPTAYWPLQVGLVGLGLGLIHPRWLNPLLGRLGRAKGGAMSTAGGTAGDSSVGDRSTDETSNPGATEDPFAASPASSADIVDSAISPDPQPPALWLARYPFGPLLGEVGFVGLRGLGFGLAALALDPQAAQVALPLISRFSLAWLAGLVIPGAPGGLGVFEATATALMSPLLPPASVLGAVALYRLVGTAAEALGAALATLDGRALSPPGPPPGSP